jgi:hypothetical protein
MSVQVRLAALWLKILCSKSCVPRLNKIYDFVQARLVRSITGQNGAPRRLGCLRQPKGPVRRNIWARRALELPRRQFAQKFGHLTERAYRNGAQLLRRKSSPVKPFTKPASCSAERAALSSIGGALRMIALLAPCRLEVGLPRRG